MEHDIRIRNSTLKPYTIAIDGPTGAGKSSLAREIAKRRALTYIDTGAMYRAIGLHVLRRGIQSEDADSIIPLLPEIELSISYKEDGQHIYLNGEDVSDKIRTAEASIYASNVSKIPKVRTFLLDTQRQLAAHGNIVMDGRDIGTVILPDADVKIFLTASPEVRALRRHKEMLAKGMQSTYDMVLEELIWRDENDRRRSTAPLKQAEDAIVLDTTDLDFEAAVARAEVIISTRLACRS